jgi:hypothetical protein
LSASKTPVGILITVDEELERCAAAAVVADIRRRIRWRVRAYRLRRFAREHRLEMALLVATVLITLWTFGGVWW